MSGDVPEQVGVEDTVTRDVQRQSVLRKGGAGDLDGRRDRVKNITEAYPLYE